MYKSILVPLDSSMFGEYALPIARSIVRRTDTKPQLVHVHEPVAVRNVEGIEVFDDKLEARNREHEQAYLDEVVTRLAVGPNIPIG